MENTLNIIDKKEKEEKFEFNSCFIKLMRFPSFITVTSDCNRKATISLNERKTGRIRFY
jgi:hypothetical protein